MQSLRSFVSLASHNLLNEPKINEYFFIRTIWLIGLNFYLHFNNNILISVVRLIID